MIKKEQIEVLMNAIKLGMNNEDCCKIARLSKEWYYQQLKKDKKFLEDVECARAEWKRRNIAIIQKAAINQWQPAAWLLERKYPEEFALRQRVEHSGVIGHRIVMVHPE